MQVPAAITQESLVHAPQKGDFEAAINLLAGLGEARRELAKLTSEIETGYLELVTSRRDDYAKIQAKVSEGEAALEVIARRNLGWFADKKSVTTPYGAVKFKASSEIVVPNEEASIVLVRKAKRSELLRVTIELNREAMQDMSDEELAKFGIVRKAKENLTVDTEVIDLGKAVRAVEKTNANAAKAAKKAKAAA